MAKKSKIATPDWILNGGKPPKEKKKGKTYSVKVCPKCRSDEVCVVVGNEEGKSADKWECKKCKWAGKDIAKKELSEDEFLDYMEKKGE
jgi:hypothetical protein